MTPPRRALFVSAVWALAAMPARGVEFERVVIDANLPGAYQVEVADVNGDGKPDVVALGGGTVAWYENPSWTKRVVTGPKQTPGVISTATADLDGDGKAEVAVAYEFAMNEPKKGKLLLARQGKTVDDPWTVKPVADVPSIHRLRWGSISGLPLVGPNSVIFTNRMVLVVAPIFGRSAKPPIFDQEPAHLVIFDPGTQPVLNGSKRPPVHWSPPWDLAAFPVLHAIDVIDLDGDGKSEILGASNLGVSLTTMKPVPFGMNAAIPDPPAQSTILAPGAPGDSPRRGASEVHVGRLRDRRRFLATVEPWHGNVVAVYPAGPDLPLRLGPREVIDDTLDEGHALWVADVDGDGDGEIFAGHRGKNHRVSVYDHNARTGAWDRTVIDRDVAAQDLRGGDLDGDGTPDVVAVGGSTHNVVWYRPVRKPR